MSIVHPLDLRRPAIFRCAQAGCAECGDRLVRQHEGLVHAVLRRQACGDAVYADLLQEGRLGLWQAVLHFDPGRGVAFSTYAWVAIERQVWRAVARSRDQPVGWEGAASVEPEAAAEAAWQQARVQVALPDALCHLPERLRRILHLPLCRRRFLSRRLRPAQSGQGPQGARSFHPLSRSGPVLPLCLP